MGILEKDINLAIATAVAANLHRSGIDVILTRSSDSFVALDRRVGIANNLGARLFVSIHCDSSPVHSAKGFSVLVPHSLSGKASSLAHVISDSLKGAGIQRHGLGREDHGVRVLDRTDAPAVLVEAGFLSNQIEASNLVTSTYQKKPADAIASAIVEYLRNN